MAWHNIVGLKLIVTLASVVVHNQVALHHLVIITQYVMAAGMNVIPLWNDMSDNMTKPCFIDNMTAEGRTITSFQGSSYRSCSFILSTSVDHRFSLESYYVDLKDGFFYIERFGSRMDCLYKYIAVYEPMDVCSKVTFLHQILQVHITGNTSVSFSEVLATESAPPCPEWLLSEKGASDSGLSQGKDCKSIKGFDSVEICKLEQGMCSHNFPSNCNITLSEKEALLMCSDLNVTQIMKWLLLYPEQPLELDLSGYHIFQIDVNSFSNLHDLQRLYLSGTALVTIQSGVFNGLHNLNFLLLRWGQLVSLDENVFRGLTNLTNLDISGNRLTKLPARLLHGLVNLRKLWLRFNQLTTLDSSTFLGLGKLRYIYLEYNKLNSLSSGLFKRLENLESLWINNNRLTDSSLQSLPFDDLTSLTVLRLDNNLYEEVHSDVFRNLRYMRGFTLAFNNLTIVDVRLFKYFKQLQRLNLHDCYLEEIPLELFDGLTNLRMLRIYANLLSTLDVRIFKSLGNLTYLDISENRFVNVPVPTRILTHLTIFKVSLNPLIKVNSNTFSSLKNNTRLLVSQHEIL